MKNGNKAAFSVAIKDNGNPYHQDAMGLTKREYFAGLAMQGLLASGEGVKTLISNNSKHEDVIVKKAIKYADELLKQLDNTP